MKFSSQTKKLLLRMVALLVVITVGALIFMLIEGEHEHVKQRSSSLTKIKQNFMANYSIPEQDFERLVEVVRDNTRHFATHIPWDFWNSLYFCVVLITTIGYGHLAPETWGGQLFCIFYSLIGIPVAALLLKSVGEYINIGINKILTLVEKQVLKRKLESREMKSFFISLFLMVLFLLFGGLITSTIEGWTMIEGVYFTFVTLSTIGFGDFVVNGGRIITADTTKTVLTPFMLIFVILGLGMVSSVCYSIVQLIETGGFSCCKRGSKNRQGLGESEGIQEEDLELSDTQNGASNA